MLRGSRNATVYPGEGAPQPVDVAVGGRADRRGRRAAAATARWSTAAGLMLCPGFIDMHAHTALESFATRS